MTRRSANEQTSPPTQTKTSATPANRKRKYDVTEDGSDDILYLGTKKISPKKPKKDEGEKRLKQYRPKPPATFLQKLKRAETQRMIVVGRARKGEGLDLCEQIDIVGTTGNIYTVTIGRLPMCSCPDSLKGNECKHKVYALRTVLKAPYELQYQTAFLTEELQTIFSNAPPIPTESDSEDDHDGKRKPIEGECPICYMDFEPDKNEIVWCKTACGNNMHKDCFEQWSKSQKGQEVKCVYCRTPWKLAGIGTANLMKQGEDTGEGYINVADQFGLDRVRDISSYHQPWARRYYGYG